MLLSSANLLDHASLHHHAKNIRESVYKVLKAGKVKTKDLGGYATTKQFTQAVINNLKKYLNLFFFSYVGCDQLLILWFPENCYKSQISNQN